MAEHAPLPPPSISSQPSIRRGFVKQVLSGDAVVLQGQPTNGPPPEATVYLSNVSAPRLGKRPTENAAGTADEILTMLRISQNQEFLRVGWKFGKGRLLSIVEISYIYIYNFFRKLHRDTFYCIEVRHELNRFGTIYLRTILCALLIRQPSSSGLSGDKKSFIAKVVEVVMSDALVVRKDDGTEMKIHLSSVRLPRDSDDKPAVGRQFRPLYDIPFMFQAREFLRKRFLKLFIVGVNCTVAISCVLCSSLFSFNFILLGIFKSARVGPGGQVIGTAEPYADEATLFTKKLVLQHEVEIEVEGIDKMGNFIGYLWLIPESSSRGQNLSELLLEQGLATLHFTAEKSGHYTAMSAAEQRAKNAKRRLNSITCMEFRRNIWANFKEEEVAEEENDALQNDSAERKVHYKKIAVTDVQKGSLKFAAQLVEDGAKLEKMTADFREQLRAHPPLTGSYNAKVLSKIFQKKLRNFYMRFYTQRGDLCAARFSVDGQWYRAKVENVRAGQAEVLYIDYGNRETVSASSLAQLPAGFAHFPPSAKEYGLALTAIPNDKDYGAQCEYSLQQLLFSVPTAELNVEYKAASVEYAQVMIESDGKKIDVGKALIADGFALVERRREPKLQELLSSYQEAEQTARRERRNIWEYGDFTGNDL
uniref:Staphylococcal nuclease domain-containing protein 1 n=1 Tax=Heterorhabditis bacteriophora TaxID=37862 RepID=A0A1I7XQM5_HETBA